tara:strand:+ start:180 stop:608 length:429 start_codon:yes stop_codon:yes gene_type:complete
MNKKENINNNMEANMKKSSGLGGLTYPIKSSLRTPSQNIKKTYPVLKFKNWVSRNLIILSTIFILSHCSYKPIIDTSGRSGTFPSNKATEITNDLQHCNTLAKEHSSIIGDALFWIASPTAETKKESIIRKCLINRGHSVLN